MQNTRRSPITTTAFLDLTIGKHAVLDSHFDTIINLSQEWTLSKTKVPRASARLQRDDIQRARRTSDSHTVPLQSSGDDGWAVHLFRFCRRKDTRSCHSRVGGSDCSLSTKPFVLRSGHSTAGLFKCSTGARHFQWRSTHPALSRATSVAPRPYASAT